MWQEGLKKDYLGVGLVVEGSSGGGDKLEQRLMTCEMPFQKT